MSLATLYPLVVVLHIAADIVFLGGLLLSALLAMALSFQPAHTLARERSLILRVRRAGTLVTAPALVVLWLCGGWLAHAAGWFGGGWLGTKMVLVLLLSALHGVLSAALRRAAGEPPVVPPRWLRAAAPLIIVVAGLIVWLVLLKPSL